eukprot:8664098-Pyramimonas_sp.AAC.1
MSRLPCFKTAVCCRRLAGTASGGGSSGTRRRRYVYDWRGRQELRRMIIDMQPEGYVSGGAS